MKRAVLAAATDQFAERGFADVSLDDVAEAAGVTRGAVYHHFRNKAALFAAVASACHQQVADAVVAAAEASRVGSDPRRRHVTRGPEITLRSVPGSGT